MRRPIALCLRALDAAGHKVTFWNGRALVLDNAIWRAGFCDLVFYSNPDELVSRHAPRLAGADAVVIRSYVPDGVESSTRLRISHRNVCSSTTSTRL